MTSLSLSLSLSEVLFNIWVVCLLNFRNEMDKKKMNRRKSGPMNIPAFGDWECVNEMPITQYFESARQAGLRIRHSSYSSSAVDCTYHPHPYLPHAPPAAADSFAVDFHSSHPTTLSAPHIRKMKKAGERRCQPHSNEARSRQGGKVCDATELRFDSSAAARRPPTAPPQTSAATAIKKQQQQKNNDAVRSQPRAVVRRAPPSNPKAVDEDLYKIPPELLHASSHPHRKKKLGFISRCLVPCAV